MIIQINEILKGLEEHLAKMAEGWYNEGYTDGYNNAMKGLAVEKGSTEDLKELEEGEYSLFKLTKDGVKEFYGYISYSTTPDRVHKKEEEVKKDD